MLNLVESARGRRHLAYRCHRLPTSIESKNFLFAHRVPKEEKKNVMARSFSRFLIVFTHV